MAPAIMENFRRYYCDDYYQNCYYSSWDTWGRWAALAGVLIFFVFLALIISAISSRRRRRAGIQPFYGTGWMANKAPPYNSTGFYGHQGPPAPPYSPPVSNQYPPMNSQYPPVNNQYTGNTFNNNDGYYGQQQSGIELQPPKNTYVPRGGEPVYQAPDGPPK